MKWWSLRILKGFCTYTHRTQTTNWRILFCQDGHGVMNVDFFFWQFFWDSYTCSSDYSVYDGRCTYTHLLHAHFSAHGACTVTFAHLHARMAQLSVKRYLHMCRFSPSRLLPSHVSPIFAVPARSLRDHSWLRLHWRSRPHVLAVLICPKSAGHAPRRTCIAKFGFRPCSMELSELGQFDLGQWG